MKSFNSLRLHIELAKNKKERAFFGLVIAVRVSRTPVYYINEIETRGQ